MLLPLSLPKPAPHATHMPHRASDKCQREKRKTINGDDLLWALQTVGFEDYVEPMQLYLAKFREAEVCVCACACACSPQGAVGGGRGGGEGEIHGGQGLCVVSPHHTQTGGGR